VTGALSLREKQALFVQLLARFIEFAYSRPGVTLTLGEGYRSDGHGHMAGSLHYVKLAQDLNLFVDGHYITDGDHPQWQELGKFWEGLDDRCRWGGRFSDANHVSIAHDGKA
jgi:hypothetical protein